MATSKLDCVPYVRTGCSRFKIAIKTKVEDVKGGRRVSFRTYVIVLFFGYTVPVKYYRPRGKRIEPPLPFEGYSHYGLSIGYKFHSILSKYAPT